MDPKGMVDGPNMYQYCGGDPVNRWDPMGTDWWVVFNGTVIEGPLAPNYKHDTMRILLEILHKRGYAGAKLVWYPKSVEDAPFRDGKTVRDALISSIEGLNAIATPYASLQGNPTNPPLMVELGKLGKAQISETFVKTGHFIVLNSVSMSVPVAEASGVVVNLGTKAIGAVVGKFAPKAGETIVEAPGALQEVFTGTNAPVERSERFNELARGHAQARDAARQAESSSTQHLSTGNPVLQNGPVTIEQYQAAHTVVSRVAEITPQLGRSAGYGETYAVAVVKMNGQLKTVVSHVSNYGVKGVTLKEGEILVGRGSSVFDAESKIYLWADQQNAQVLSIGATRPMCPSCTATAVSDSIPIVTPIKR